MLEKKTKQQIKEDSVEEIEMACVNIHDNLQANEVTFADEDIMSLSEKFYEVMRKQNSKVIVTGDGK